MTRLFSGDYSTGDFRQWPGMLNKLYDIDNSVRHPTSGTYAASIVADDLDCGYCARFEARTGDVPPALGGGERTEALGLEGSYSAVGTTRWYAFSIKLDTTFPTNYPSALDWDVLIQWKSATITPFVQSYGSPVLAMGYALETDPGYSYRDGYWYMFQNPQSAPNVFTGPAVPFLELPLSLGEWHDLKMRITWAQDTSGTVQVWHNGARQTFADGATTFTGQTVVGGVSTGVIVQQGIYREAGTVPTEIVYHKGFRIADSESSL